MSADKPSASDSLLTPPSRSEAEARIQMALKVARSGLAAISVYSLPGNIITAQQKALREIIRILDNGAQQ